MKNKIINMKINMKINFQLIKEDAQYEYLLPEYPFCSCTFAELEQKCLYLKKCLPEDIVDVYVPTAYEVIFLPDSEEVRNCGVAWWTSSLSAVGGYVDFVDFDGSIEYGKPSYSYGFRPMIIRRKQSIRDKVENDLVHQERGFVRDLSDIQKGYMDDM